MIVGTTVFKMDGNAYYSPEFPRGGLAGTFAVEVTNLVGSPTIGVKVQSRNEDATSFTDTGTFSDITAVGLATLDVSPLGQVCRFSFEFAAGDDATDGAHFMFLPPIWRPYP
jgi:hypothetical protein